MKKQMKESEARILIYLSNADLPICYGRHMATKLHMDYAYLLGLLASMQQKEWVTGHKTDGKKFYKLTQRAKDMELVNKAIEVRQK